MTLPTHANLRSALLIALGLLSAACSSPEEQKQRHFAQGNAYAAEKRDDFAVIEYANAVRIDPKFGEARLKLAETYERMKNLRAAFPEFIRAADALPNNRDLQLKATRLLLLSARFEDAKARATTLLTKNPNDVDALLLRANAMSVLKDPAGATADIEDALKAEPSDSRAFVALGGIHIRSGEAKEAEAAFRQAIALQPSSHDAHLAFANFLWSAGRPTEAEQELKQTVSLEPRHLMANRMLAALYRATNRPAEAEQPLKVVAEVSQAAPARFELAQYYLAVRRDNEATKLLADLAADKATFARAEGMLAAMDYDRGRKQQAHARLDKLLVQAPKDPDALMMKARWFLNEKKADQALDPAKAAVAADPQSARAHYTLGVVHSLRGDVTDAIKDYNEALRLNPRFAAAQIQLSRVNYLKGDRDTAVRYAQEAKQTVPASGDAGIALVRSLLATRDLAAAEAELKVLLKNWPNASIVHMLNGTLQGMRNNDTASRAAFKRALELDPDNWDAFGGIIGLDVKEKRFGDAIKSVEAELSKQPNRTELLWLAALVYDRAGQKNKVEQVLRHAVSVNSQFLTGYTMLAQLYVSQRRLDEARAELETVVKKEPKAVGPRTMVGIILEAQGKRDEARRWYEATVAELPSAPVAANNLAFIYAEDGTNLDMAVQLATNARKALPENPQVSDTLGWAYYKKGLPALALGPLEESAKALPNNADVQYHLGMTYAKLNEKAKAREALGRALKINPKFAGAATARQTLESLTP